MYTSYIRYFHDCLKDLESVLQLSLKEKDPVLALIAQDSRIYAFQRCSRALKDLLLALYLKTLDKGTDSEDSFVRVFSNALRSLDDDTFQKEMEEKNCGTLLAVLVGIADLPDTHLKNLLLYQAGLKFFDEVPDMLSPEDKAEYLELFDIIFKDISRFYYSGKRLSGILILSGSNL